jgi:hypothetical protein
MIKGLVGQASTILETMDLYRQDISSGNTRRTKSTISYLDGLGIQLKSFLFIGKKFLYILALIALKLNHLSHLTINDDGAIASYL